MSLKQSAGRATVLAGSVALLLPAVAGAAASPSPSRIVTKPIVTYAVSPAGLVNVAAFVRLDRALPRRGGATLLGGVRVAGVGPATAPAAGASSFEFRTLWSRGGRHCYQQTLTDFERDGTPLARPVNGRLVRVEVVVDGLARRLTRYTRLQRVSWSSFGADEHLVELGCRTRAEARR